MSAKKRRERERERGGGGTEGKVEGGKVTKMVISNQQSFSQFHELLTHKLTIRHMVNMSQ